MGTRKLKRLLRRNPSHSVASPKTPSVTAHPRARPTFLLRQFIATLGPRAEASLSKGWLHTGTAVNSASECFYHFRQGRDHVDLPNITHQLNARLVTNPARLQAGGWTRLLLGPEYSHTPAKKYTHFLSFVITYCPCLACRVDAIRGDLAMDDMDQMLEDAERGHHFVQIHPLRPTEELVDHRDHRHHRGDPVFRARSAARFQDLPHITAFQLIGDSLGNHEFELGKVTKISARTCRVAFAPFAKQFFTAQRYCGPLAKSQVSEIVAEKAKDHYRQYKGKTERRFYVHGTLVNFLIDACGLALNPLEDNNPATEHALPIGVLFRKQLMSVFIGQLALEDSFGSFLHMDAPFYMGFSQDPEGAQTVFSDGSMGQARHLGINELRTHLEIGAGDELQILMR